MVEQVGRREAVKRIVRRGLLLVALGIVQYGGFSRPWPHIRLLGVLQRIGICYLVTGLLFVFMRPRGLAAVCVALLVGYWALMTFVPIRNIQLEEEALKARLPAAAAPAPTSPSDPRIASGGHAQGTSPATNGAPRRRSRDEDAPDPTALFF